MAQQIKLIANSNASDTAKKVDTLAEFVQLACRGNPVWTFVETGFEGVVATLVRDGVQDFSLECDGEWPGLILFFQDFAELKEQWRFSIRYSP